MFRLYVVLLAVALLVVALASPLAAQIPEKFENLQVLPKDIPQRELIDRMRGMTRGLGARCHFCHVGEPGASLEGYDFASDEKAEKRTARVMMRMVAEINGDHLPKIGKESAALIQVSCETCHRGQTRPRSLESVLAEVVESEGVEAAVAKYRELRERYYGSHAFDFTERRLVRVAEDLADQGELAAALRLIDLNIEFYPESGRSYFSRGQLHARQDEIEKAIASYHKAAELSPDFAPRIREMIEELSEESSGARED